LERVAYRDFMHNPAHPGLNYKRILRTTGLRRIDLGSDSVDRAPVP